MKQLTREQAIALHQGGDWKNWDDETIVKLQLFQDRLCVPFGRYHQAIEAVLGRDVATHEFGSVGTERLRAEYLGLRPAPTKQDILDLIPAEKRIAFTLDSGDEA
jgi:hypothetical protein